MLKRVLKLLLINKFLVLLLILGTASWSLTMVKSGWIYEYGMGFWGANGHDGIWHVSLINSLSTGSFNMPVFAGGVIKNYHLGFDLIVALTHNLTKIPSVNLYFQVFPPIIAFLVGISVYLFIYEWKKSKLAALLATFFIYFGGDISWIIGRGESTFWGQQSISTLINPPFALSLIFIFLGLYFVVSKKPLLSVIFFGLLLETKAYAGVLILGTLLLVSIWEFLRERKLGYFKIFVASSLLTLGIFLLLNRGSENLFVFSPFWFLGTLFGPDRLPFPKFDSAITNYNLAHNYLKLIPAYLVAFIVFWVGNMWTRLFKEIEVLKWIKKPKSISPLDVFVTSVIIGGAVIPMLFLQKGTAWNTIQFFYYSLIFSGVLAGVSISNFLEKRGRAVKIVLVVAVIALTIPTTLKTLSEVYIPGRPPAMISNNELEALDFLSKMENGVVLTYPYDADAAKAAESNPPRPLYLYDSTSYVSAFSGHTTFLEDQVNLDITNFDWQTRRDEILKNFVNTSDKNVGRKFLMDNHIKYLYIANSQKIKLRESQLGLVKIFGNDEVDIYKVN